MADQQPLAWNKLKCECGGIYFFQKLHLISKSGGGTTTEFAGYVCRDCQGDVDIARLIQRLEIERKREELTHLQTELAQVPNDNLKIKDRATVQLKEGG